MRRHPSAQLLVVAVASLAARAAQAQDAVDCSTLDTPLFVPGTTDVKPFLTRVAPKLATAPEAQRMTVVYQALGSCTALDYVTGDTVMTGTAVYWDGETDEDGEPVEKSCEVPAGTRAHLALSDVNVQTCTGEPAPAGLAEISSMVQGFGLVVPRTSTQQAITATEAYFLFKFGGEEGRGVPPWTDPQLVAVRTPASSTQLLIGLAAGVPGTVWSANLTNTSSGSSGVIAKVAAESSTGNAEKTLGILSLQRYDGARDELRMLAFESFEQECLGAVYPDSTATAFDKRNIRDGHYSIWGYLWSVVPAGDDGRPTDPAAARFIDFIGGTEEIGGADPIADAARAGGVPACAMTVRRTHDGGSLEPYEPPEPCGCYFESVATGSTDCASCGSGDDCPGGTTCRFGFCEQG